MSAKWNEIVRNSHGHVAGIPTENDADQFGHVIWFNPVTGAIVDKWNKASTNYTHWRKTDLPDVVGQKFEQWVKGQGDCQQADWFRENLIFFESAFRAGAAIR